MPIPLCEARSMIGAGLVRPASRARRTLKSIGLAILAWRVPKSGLVHETKKHGPHIAAGLHVGLRESVDQLRRRRITNVMLEQLAADEMRAARVSGKHIERGQDTVEAPVVLDSRKFHAENAARGPAVEERIVAKRALQLAVAGTIEWGFIGQRPAGEKISQRGDIPLG